MMNALQHAILSALRYGPLNQFQLAAELDEAPFRIRAELKWMRRERLVIDRLDTAEVSWLLTDQGAGIAWAQAQPELFR
jgi:hypothetical protein